MMTALAIVATIIMGMIAVATATTGATKSTSSIPTATFADVNGNDVAVGAPGASVQIAFTGPQPTAQQSVQSTTLAWVLGGFSVSIPVAPTNPVTVQVWDTTQGISSPAANNYLVWQGTFAQAGFYNIKFQPAKKMLGGTALYNPGAFTPLTGYPSDGFAITATGPGGAGAVTLAITEKWVEAI